MKKKLAVCLTLITGLWSMESNAQVSNPNNAWSTGAYVGWNSASNLDFKLGTTPTQYMIIDGTTNIGYVGIGTTTPSQKLTVTGGAMNVQTPTRSYMINGSKILWHNGDPTSIFAGVGAGASAPASGSLYNTLVGRDAGTSLTTAQQNTFIGFEAGKSLVSSVYANVAVGYQALYSNTGWGRNTAVGYKALYELNTACAPCEDGANLNTAVGYEAMYSTQVYGVCGLGYKAGHENKFGCYLIAVGEEAAFHNIDASANIAIGSGTLHKSRHFENNIALGHWSLIT